MTRLSIVIVSYNVKHYLEQCLRSVRKASCGVQMDVWVVDNASTDGTVEHLSQLFPEVHFVCNTDNKGFSAANNQAIRMSQGEYVLLLNPDTIVGEDVLRGCIDFLDTHPRAGAVGVRMLHADGAFAPESRRGVPTPFTSFCKMSGLCAMFPRSRVFGRYYMRYLDADKPSRIDIISGAFNMLRREALEQVGLLDERFFMYGEDVDLSFRLLQSGWENWYLPLNILHYKGESTKKNSFRYVHVFYNAMLLFYNKHYGQRRRVLGCFVKMAVVGRAALDVCLRFWRRFGAWLHCQPQAPHVDYMTFIFDSQPVHDMLERLRTQSAPRRTLETRLDDTGIIIRPDAVLPIHSAATCADESHDGAPSA